MVGGDFPLPGRNPGRRLIVTGDDFGASPCVNEAIEKAYGAGWLQQTSLIVTGRAVDEAVRIARRNPQLAIGLHLTLCDGRATRRSRITDSEGHFTGSPARAGWHYFFDRTVRSDLAQEIAEQFSHFESLGFEPIYWDGHCHLHLHPVILKLTLPHVERFGFTRLVRQPQPRTIRETIFNELSRRAVPKLQAAKIGRADLVFGLQETGRMDTLAFERAITRIPDSATAEIYYHPGTEPSELDWDRLKGFIAERGVKLQPYQVPRVGGLR
jgi:chitin disaccharide deacetylase